MSWNYLYNIINPEDLKYGINPVIRIYSLVDEECDKRAVDTIKESISTTFEGSFPKLLFKIETFIFTYKNHSGILFELHLRIKDIDVFIREEVQNLEIFLNSVIFQLHGDLKSMFTMICDFPSVDADFFQNQFSKLTYSIVYGPDGRQVKRKLPNEENDSKWREDLMIIKKYLFDEQMRWDDL